MPLAEAVAHETQVSVSDVRQNLEEILDRVGTEEFVIVRRGQKLARIIPAERRSILGRKPEPLGRDFILRKKVPDPDNALMNALLDERKNGR